MENYQDPNSELNQTKSTMQKTINRHVNQIGICQDALTARKRRINRYRTFLHILIKEGKITKEEVDEFFKKKK